MNNTPQKRSTPSSYFKKTTYDHPLKGGLYHREILKGGSILYRALPATLDNANYPALVLTAGLGLGEAERPRFIPVTVLYKLTPEELAAQPWAAEAKANLERALGWLNTRRLKSRFKRR